MAAGCTGVSDRHGVLQAIIRKRQSAVIVFTTAAGRGSGTQQAVHSRPAKHR